MLSDKDKIDCEGKLSFKEITESINALKYNKSPGIYGLTVEFYKTFWAKFKLIASGNWRPITLLNIDYKIAA